MVNLYSHHRITENLKNVHQDFRKLKRANNCLSGQRNLRVDYFLHRKRCLQKFIACVRSVDEAKDPLKCQQTTTGRRKKCQHSENIHCRRVSHLTNATRQPQIKMCGTLIFSHNIFCINPSVKNQDQLMTWIIKL